ncbi:hypothetical protein P2H44_03390 [Albimonas sp. CAU 1670]|uniref:hypothetical protein n=1 Tax=Albimonas sp. CAU 1670 TaxID=3032599 RepID=UPI0023DA994F|nr:hypothetical protein [Albimonas sp. CAU 1670]MDF2231588.1 hypothetical protein [Albimonas sp. CAU 1670]
MRTSEKPPAGSLNDWPIDDWNACVYLMNRSAEILSRHPPFKDEGDARFAVRQSLEDAAEDAGLGKYHWLVDNILASVWGIFYVRSGDYYSDAKGLLNSNRPLDLEHLGPEVFEWARRIESGRAES